VELNCIRSVDLIVHSYVRPSSCDLTERLAPLLVFIYRIPMLFDDFWFAIDIINSAVADSSDYCVMRLLRFVHSEYVTSFSPQHTARRCNTPHRIRCDFVNLP